MLKMKTLSLIRNLLLNLTILLLNLEISGLNMMKKRDNSGFRVERLNTLLRRKETFSMSKDSIEQTLSIGSSVARLQLWEPLLTMSLYLSSRMSRGFKGLWMAKIQVRQLSNLIDLLNQFSRFSLSTTKISSLTLMRTTSGKSVKKILYPWPPRVWNPLQHLRGKNRHRSTVPREMLLSWLEVQAS